MLFGQPLAVTFYEKNGDRISLFTADAAAGADHLIRRSFDAVDHRDCRTVDAYRVCLHRDGDMLVGIVADARARPEELLSAGESF